MESKKIAIIAGSVFMVILLLGVNGFSVKGEEVGIPAITAPDQAFFSEEPLPTNPVPALVSAKVTITWSEEDIWLVIVDSDEKDRCSTNAPSTFFDVCNSRDVQATAGGIENNNIDGFSWNVENGEYYAGLGQKNSNGPGTVDVYYDVKLRISGLVAVVLIGLSGACFGNAFTRE